MQWSMKIFEISANQNTLLVLMAAMFNYLIITKDSNLVIFHIMNGHDNFGSNWSIGFREDF